MLQFFFSSYNCLNEMAGHNVCLHLEWTEYSQACIKQATVLSNHIFPSYECLLTTGLTTLKCLSIWTPKKNTGTPKNH